MPMETRHDLEHTTERLTEGLRCPWKWGHYLLLATPISDKGSGFPPLRSQDLIARSSKFKKHSIALNAIYFYENEISKNHNEGIRRETSIFRASFNPL